MRDIRGRVCRWQDDHRYDLQAIGESNELERSSSVILSVYADEAMRVSEEALVQLLKNRNGVTREEPFRVYVNPRFYVFGQDSLDVSGDALVGLDDFDSIFSSDDDNMLDIF